MRDYHGTDVASLWLLSIALARDAIFGKEEMAKKSLSGRKKVLASYRSTSLIIPTFSYCSHKIIILT